MNPWDLFLLVSLTVIFQKPLKAILKTDQENKPWMKIQPTCQPQPWRAVRESPPHKKHGVFTQKAWGWGRDARTVIFMLRVERKASCVHGALSSQVEEATWQEPHSATALESSHFSFWLFFFFLLWSEGIKWSMNKLSNISKWNLVRISEWLLKWYDTFNILSKSTVFELKYALCLSPAPRSG